MENKMEVLELRKKDTISRQDLDEGMNSLGVWTKYSPTDEDSSVWDFSTIKEIPYGSGSFIYYIVQTKEGSPKEFWILRKIISV